MIFLFLDIIIKYFLNSNKIVQIVTSIAFEIVGFVFRTIYTDSKYLNRFINICRGYNNFIFKPISLLRIPHRLSKFPPVQKKYYHFHYPFFIAKK